MCVSGNDNLPVLVIPNVHGPTLVTTVKSWSSQTKEYIKKDRLYCIALHNKHMAGADSLDALVGV